VPSWRCCDKPLREPRTQPMPTDFTSDHHFGHAGALGLYHRPFASVAEMDRQMIDRWNSVIGPDDEVWHLGDFAIRQRPDRVAALVKALHGRKHLIIGNNDDAAVNGCDG
jgi:calcineurin-like phosphoesterase family protein